MITINHERYGMRQEFATVAEAQQTIRDCGPEFASTRLYVDGGRVYNERGECVGSGAESPTIEQLVSACETGGRSFADVRREYGDDVYRAVRDECVRRGRGTVELTVVSEDDRGGIVCEVE